MTLSDIRIKPLVWNDFIAQTQFGYFYEIIDRGSWGWVAHCAEGNAVSKIACEMESEQMARRVCQIHYEQRAHSIFAQIVEVEP